MLRRVLNKLKKREADPDFIYTIKGDIASIDVTLPYGHKLQEYQLKYKNYDKKLLKIAKAVYDSKKGVGVDIGANVGDTAAGIRASTKMPLICIEGDEEFFQYLERNTKNLEGITRVRSFVSGEHTVKNAQLVKKEGSGRIVEQTDGSSKVSFSPLTEILSSINIKPEEISLIKIDTDGFDFDIILGSLNLISTYKPALFYEHEVNAPGAHEKSIEVNKALSAAGYKFIVYDNYGNFVSSITSDGEQRIEELNAFIRSGLANGGGICYADIFAVADEKIFQSILEQELKK
jgi:FkbM family methyltransferase